MKSFSSDNYSGIAPEILQAIQEANINHVPSGNQNAFFVRLIENAYCFRVSLGQFLF
jgi:hypothetical protein